MPNDSYDITAVITTFSKGGYKERQELMRKLGPEFNHNRALQIFLAEVCDETSKQGAKPVVAMAQSMLYGLVLGIILEKENQQHKRRLII